MSRKNTCGNPCLHLLSILSLCTHYVSITDPASPWGREKVRGEDRQWAELIPARTHANTLSFSTMVWCCLWWVWWQELLFCISPTKQIADQIAWAVFLTAWGISLFVLDTSWCILIQVGQDVSNTNNTEMEPFHGFHLFALLFKMESSNHRKYQDFWIHKSRRAIAKKLSDFFVGCRRSVWYARDSRMAETAREKRLSEKKGFLSVLRRAWKKALGPTIMSFL